MASASPIFARALAAERAQLNAMVAQARQRQSAFDVEALRAFALAAIDPIAQAVATVDAASVPAVTTAAFEIAIELVSQSLAGPGARTPIVNRVWRELAPALAAFVVVRPVAVLGSITNAAVNIEKVNTARPAFWLEQMLKLGPRAGSQEELLALGQVLAWRAGMAHYRAGALDAADRLGVSLALAAMGADADWPTVRARLRSDRWWSPDKEIREEAATGIQIGAFSGFGGMFRLPPQVRASADGFWVESAERYAFLMADVHGAVLISASKEEFEQAPLEAGEKRPPPIPTAAGLVANGQTIPIDVPLDGLRVARNQDSLAIASPYSYSIRVVRRP